MGGDQRSKTGLAIDEGFNPRPRMGGDSHGHAYRVGIDQFQSTPPHGGRHARLMSSSLSIPVSIHAPAWGATHSKGLTFSQLKVSIHAPAWGATSILPSQALGNAFQSTPPHGGRPLNQRDAQAMQQFQSTPPHGGRLSQCG